MNRYLKSVTILAAVAVLVLGVSTVVAQETTGGLRGSVKDDTGTPIAGAVVEASGPLGTLSATTDANGEFRFPRMAAGDYTVVAKYVGYIDAATDARVILGQSSSIDFSLQQSFREEITVYSDTVAIDFTESQTATSIRKWEIDYLPRGRDFTDVVTFAAGTQEGERTGGISIDGSSGLENRFIIDGIDTTDPQIGDNSVPMRAEFMEEVQVKSSGYAAEFGGSTGGVINAVTRSGSNEFHGALLTDYSSESWNGSARPDLEYSLDDPDVAQLTTYRKDDETRWDPGIVLGGPIIRDRLWFFGTYQPGIRNTKRTVEFTDGYTDTYEQDFTVDYASLNVTTNLGSKVLLKLGGNISPYTTDGYLPGVNGRTSVQDQDSYAPYGTEGERETYSLTGDWIAADNFVVSGRVGFYHTNVTDTGIPFYDLIHNYSTGSVAGFTDRHPEIPSQWATYPGWSDNTLYNVRAYDTYERTAAGLDATWYFKAAGEHSLKFGYQGEEIFNDVRDGYNADRILYYWDRSYTTTSGNSVTGDYGYFRLLNISTFGEVKTRNEAIFVQDAWSVLPNLTLNLGLRAEHERVPNFGATGPDPAIEFDYGDKVAPRLGFAWDVMGDSKWKAYGSYGVYYDVTKYEMPRGSFGGDKWVDYFFTFDTANPGLNTYPACGVGNNTIFDNPSCGAGTFIEAVDRRFNSVDPLYEEIVGAPGIDPNLQPMEMWEAQLGVDHQLTSTVQVGARYVHKQLVRAIEDLGFLYPGVGEVYIIANPGEGVGISAPGDTSGLVYPKAEREYDALELTFDKRFSNNWSLRAYYTLSRLYGNYSGLANTEEQNNPGGGARLAPNVSRLFDTASSMYDASGNLVYGDLATNRTHQLGAQFLYSFDFGLSVGVNQYIGSGNPKTEVVTVPVHSFTNPLGRGNLGTTPWITQTDLSLWQTFKLTSRFNLSFGLTILNLFDEDAATSYWTVRNVTDLPVTDAEIAGGYDYEAALAELGASGLDTRYGFADAFQAPRDLRLTVKFEF